MGVCVKEAKGGVGKKAAAVATPPISTPSVLMGHHLFLPCAWELESLGRYQLAFWVSGEDLTLLQFR